MSDRLDRSLAAIDVGLQRAGDDAYGSDNGMCVRCQLLPSAEGSSWCAHCPITGPTAVDLAALAALAPRLMDVLVPMIAETVQRIEYLAEAVGPTVTELVELNRKMDQVADPRGRALARKRRAFTCHRHGVQVGGFCRVCIRR